MSPVTPSSVVRLLPRSGTLSPSKGAIRHPSSARTDNTQLAGSRAPATVAAMSTVAEIEAAIAKLPASQQWEIAKWLEESP